MNQLTITGDINLIEEKDLALQHITFDKISKFPTNFNELKNLRSLTITNSSISIIPQPTNDLHVLDVKNCPNITEVRDWIKEKNVRRVSFVECNISSVPRCLENVDELVLDNNRIEKLNGYVQHFKCYKFSINYNYLTNTNILPMKALFISVDKNLIGEINVVGFKNLWWFSSRKNCTSHCPSFNGCDNLTLLDLSDNYISEIDERIRNRLKLKVVCFDNNKTEFIAKTDGTKYLTEKDEDLVEELALYMTEHFTRIYAQQAI